MITLTEKHQKYVVKPISRGVEECTSWWNSKGTWVQILWYIHFTLELIKQNFFNVQKYSQKNINGTNSKTLIQFLKCWTVRSIRWDVRWGNRKIQLSKSSLTVLCELTFCHLLEIILFVIRQGYMKVEYSPDMVAHLRNTFLKTPAFEEFNKNKINWCLHSTLPFKACSSSII